MGKVRPAEGGLTLKRLMQYSLLAVSWLTTISSVVGKPTPEKDLAVTLCVMNDAGVPAAVEEAVERRVETSMEEAGIQIRWLRGRDNGRTAEVRCLCSHPEPMRVLVLHWMATGKATTPGELGEAFTGEDGRGVAADLFLDRMERLEEERGIGFAQLLAYVTEHELGHLLLGANSHSTSGLMQARMNEQTLVKIAQGGSRFSREQVKRMKERAKGENQFTGWRHLAASCSATSEQIPMVQAEAR